MDGWNAEESDKWIELEEGRGLGWQWVGVKRRRKELDRGTEEGTYHRAGGFVGAYIGWNAPIREEILDILWAVGVELCVRVGSAGVSC